MALDLTAFPVVDVHCHPWDSEACLAQEAAEFEDRITMMGMCQLTSGTSSHLGTAIRDMTEATPLALAMRRRLAELLGVSPDRAEVAEARHAAFASDPDGWLHRLMADAGIAALFCDEGYPQPTLDLAPLRTSTGVPIHRVGRIEPWILELAASSGSYAELEEAFVGRVEAEAQTSDLRAFKSVIAYRTGLDITRPSVGEAQHAFERWRSDRFRETRAHAKPVRDLLLRRTLEVAQGTGVPVHIHCGGGDPDVELAHARPTGLFELISDFAGTPIVLIHSGWPWIEEAAFIASIMPAVFLDVSVLLPWASLALDQKLEVLLGAVPTNKVMYGSDEASEPEVIWFSAHVGRSALGRVLSRAVERDWLDEPQALRIAGDVLAGNALRLHGVSADALDADRVAGART
jgi:uncharacterized protein